METQVSISSSLSSCLMQEPRSSFLAPGKTTRVLVFSSLGTQEEGHLPLLSRAPPVSRSRPLWRLGPASLDSGFAPLGQSVSDLTSVVSFGVTSQGYAVRLLARFGGSGEI